MPRYNINPKSSMTIHFAASEAGLAAGTDATFQMIDFEIKHNPQLTEVPATYGAGASRDVALATYDLVLRYLQDWGVNAASISKYFYDNEGSTVWFSIEPTGGVDTVDGMKGTCVIPGVDYGGPADENWIAEVTCPCPAKPTRVADT